MSRRPPPPNRDYTTARRAAAFRARAAVMLPQIALDQQHADALAAILARTGETRAACMRRLILAEAVHLGLTASLQATPPPG